VNQNTGREIVIAFYVWFQFWAAAVVAGGNSFGSSRCPRPQQKAGSPLFFGLLQGTAKRLAANDTPQTQTKSNPKFASGRTTVSPRFSWAEPAGRHQGRLSRF